MASFIVHIWVFFKFDSVIGEIGGKNKEHEIVKMAGACEVILKYKCMDKMYQY